MTNNPKNLKIEDPMYAQDPNLNQISAHLPAGSDTGDQLWQQMTPGSQNVQTPVSNFLLSQQTLLSPKDQKFKNIMKLHGKINQIKSNHRVIESTKIDGGKLSTRRASHATRSNTLMKETAKLKVQALQKQRNKNRSTFELNQFKPQTVKNGVNQSQLIFGISQNQAIPQQLDQVLYNHLILEQPVQNKPLQLNFDKIKSLNRGNTPSIQQMQIHSPDQQETQANFKLFENRKSMQVNQIHNDLNDQENYNQRRIKYVERQMQHLQRQRNKSQQQLGNIANQYQLRKIATPSASQQGILPSEFFNKRNQMMMNQQPISDHSGSVDRQQSQMLHRNSQKHQISELRIKNFNDIKNADKSMLKTKSNLRSNEADSRSNSSELDPHIIENRYKRLNKNYNQIFKNLNEQRADYKNMAIVNQHMINSQEMNYYNKKQHDGDNSTFEHPLQPSGSNIKDYFAMPTIASPTSDANMMNTTAAASNQQNPTELPAHKSKADGSNNNYQNNINNSIILVQSPDGFISSQQQPVTFNQVSQDLRQLQDQLRMGVIRDQYFSNRDHTHQSNIAGERKKNSPTSEGAPYRSKIAPNESESIGVVVSDYSTQEAGRAQLRNLQRTSVTQGNRNRLSNSPQELNTKKRSRNRTNNVSQNQTLSQDIISSNDPESLDRQNTHMLMQVLYNSLKKQSKKPMRKKTSLAQEVKGNLLQQSVDYIQNQKKQPDNPHDPRQQLSKSQISPKSEINGLISDENSMISDQNIKRKPNFSTFIKNKLIDLETGTRSMVQSTEKLDDRSRNTASKDQWQQNFQAPSKTQDVGQIMDDIVKSDSSRNRRVNKYIESSIMDINIETPLVQGIMKAPSHRQPPKTTNQTPKVQSKKDSRSKMTSIYPTSYSRTSKNTNVLTMEDRKKLVIKRTMGPGYKIEDKPAEPKKSEPKSPVVKARASKAPELFKDHQEKEKLEDTTSKIQKLLQDNNMFQNLDSQQITSNLIEQLALQDELKKSKTPYMKQMHESNNLYKGESTVNRLNNKKRIKLIIMQKSERDNQSPNSDAKALSSQSRQRNKPKETTPVRLDNSDLGIVRTTKSKEEQRTQKRLKKQSQNSLSGGDDMSPPDLKNHKTATINSQAQSEKSLSIQNKKKSMSFKVIQNQDTEKKQQVSKSFNLINIEYENLPKESNYSKEQKDHIGQDSGFELLLFEKGKKPTGEDSGNQTNFSQASKRTAKFPEADKIKVITAQGQEMSLNQKEPQSSDQRVKTDDSKQVLDPIVEMVDEQIVTFNERHLKSQNISVLQTPFSEENVSQIVSQTDKSVSLTSEKNLVQFVQKSKVSETKNHHPQKNIDILKNKPPEKQQSFQFELKPSKNQLKQQPNSPSDPKKLKSLSNSKSTPQRLTANGQPKASKALSLRKEVRTSEQNSREMGEFASFSEYLIHQINEQAKSTQN